MNRELVVVGIDSEPPSFAAVDWVIERASTIPLRVRLVAVQESPLWGANKARERLAQAVARIAGPRPEVPVETVVSNGTIISETLVDQAADADLLVIGHHRGRIVSSALAGAIPMQIARRAPCPVVVVPEDWLRRFGKTVVGLEWDRQSSAALAFAVEETAAFGRSLDIVHVEFDGDHPGSPRSIPEPDVPADRVEQLRKAVEVVRTRQPTLAVRTFDAAGDPDRILRAHAREAALIVVGNHGAGAIESLLHGSRAYGLMNWSKAPLCIVPSGWRPEPPRGGHHVDRDRLAADVFDRVPGFAARDQGPYDGGK